VGHVSQCKLLALFCRASSLRSTTQSRDTGDFLAAAGWPRIGGLRRVRFGFCWDQFGAPADFGRVVSGPGNPVARQRRLFQTETRFDNGDWAATEHLALTGQFRGKVAESDHAHSEGEPKRVSLGSKPACSRLLDSNLCPKKRVVYSDWPQSG